MKKLTAIILAAIMLLSAVSLASCKKEEVTAKLIYGKMTANLLSYDAYEANMAVNMDMGVAGQDVSIKTTMEYNIKADDMKSDSPIGYADIKMDMLGQTVEVTSYTEGDYVYITSMGEGMKLPKDSVLAADYNTSETINAYEIDVPAEILESTEYTTDEEGNYVLSFTFTKDNVDILQELIDNILAGMEQSLSDFDFELGDVKYVLVADKDYAPKSMKMDMTMTISSQGVTMSVLCSVNCEYVAFGDAVIITPPEGYQNYEELIA